MRALIIANPISGRGRGHAAAQRLQDSLDRKGVRSSLAITHARGEACALVRDESRFFDMIVAVGGDGTLSEVINGLPAEGPPLGLLPTGTANILAIELGIPHSPRRCAEVLLRGETRSMNLLEVNGQRSFLMVSVGLEAAVLKDLERRRKGSITKLSYLWPTASTFWKYRVPELSVALDGETPRPCAECFVTNVRLLGTRLLRFDHQPILDDGKAEAYLCQAASRWDLLRHASRLVLGRLTRAKDVDFRRVGRVRVESEHPTPYQVDGDYAGETPVDVRVLPQQLRILVPAPPQTNGSESRTS